MSIPSTPSTAVLKDNLTHAGKYVRTFSTSIKGNWNIPNATKGLTQFSSKDFRNLSKLTNALNEQKGLLDELKAIKKTTQAATKAKETADATKKLSDNLKKVQDILFRKLPGSDQFDKAARIGGILGILAAIGTVALLKFQEFISDRTFDNLDAISNDLTKTNQIAVQNGLKLKQIQSKIDKFDRELDANAKDFAKLNKQTETIGQQVTAAKKQANDALYETREGRRIVTGLAESARKLANDTLYEFRQNKLTVEAKINEQRISFDAKIQSINAQISRFNNTASEAFQKSVNSTISKLQSDLAAARSQLSAIKPATPTDTASITANAVAAAKAEVNGLKAVISGLTTQINAAMQLGSTAISSVGNLAQGISSANSTASQALNEIKTSAAKNLGTMQQQLDAKFNEVVAQNTKDLKIRDLSQSNLSKEFDQKLADFERLNKLSGEERYQALIEDNRRTLGGVDLKLSKLSQEFDKYFEDFKQQSTKSSEQLYEEFIAKNKSDLSSVKSEVVAAQKEIQGSKADITKIDTKLKEQAKVNEQALPKLDQILDKLPFIPALAAAAIRPDIPTIPQIEQAAATGTCRTTQSGGCMRRALDESVGNINQNTNNRINALDIANTGANAALLMGQQTILQRLGNQLPGGIGGKLTRFTQWLQLDRALNVLTFTATVQNHLMLSNDIGQTLLGAFTNVLTLIGLKDDNDQPYDIGNIINSTIENLVKGIVGAENYTVISEAWSKANRIYQATNNVLNSFLNLSQTILQASEMIASNTGKIGNALRKGGIILESAYGWMNPQPKFNRVTGFLEKLQNGASTIQMVTQAPLDIVNATTELTTASTDFVKAIKEDNKPENKATPTPEPDELKAKEQASKADSQPVNFDFSDLFDGED
ncbi:hypothetical protein VF14_24535 [Nostoc linckia z18]|uniref:Uncharacterized protein n=2 Tax=Nostoc linckia TaxID=92942 RepID=A0A9Q5Z7K8_NOSLI|nr:hypothetical protein [Nostoc linckia]PHK27725.1 hypothetical protein VF12_34260 [Nostoc linckia z15]PHK43373.1 hypothetical protein VF13_27365 [Nostoc linckia z16]PHJ57377.1 hypothetical protein VF02_30260 [Nostoc linckia z1]PHJ59991.1 hypothetical protein VF05_31065 [Nostoc linckia z3]PHJ64853.1 hypothetical protein VF03_28310 [Nostoc linckia z2]